MLIFPAIDLYDKKAVRLYKGDYEQMTVYSENPVLVAKEFVNAGATHIHLVDLQGAKTGDTPNFETVCEIKKESGVFCEIGGGVRSLEVIEKYVKNGIDRVILGTAAVTDTQFVKTALKEYKNKIAIGVDIKDGFVAIKGWTQKSDTDAFEFCERMKKLGAENIICTDISKDGAMTGTNRELYKKLSEKFDLNITASGGVSSLSDVAALRKMNLYGAIIGKAYYTGDIDLCEAIGVAK